MSPTGFNSKFRLSTIKNVYSKCLVSKNRVGYRLKKHLTTFVPDFEKPTFNTT